MLIYKLITNDLDEYNKDIFSEIHAYVISIVDIGELVNDNEECDGDLDIDIIYKHRKRIIHGLRVWIKNIGCAKVSNKVTKLMHKTVYSSIMLELLEELIAEISQLEEIYAEV